MGFHQRIFNFLGKIGNLCCVFFFFVDVGVLQIPVQELIQFQISLSLQVQLQVNEVTCTLQERVCVYKQPVVVVNSLSFRVWTEVDFWSP